MKYERMVELEDGWCRWVYPKPKLYKMACCDCGLVHDLQFKIQKWGRGYRVRFRARRNNRATAAMRRHKK